MCISSPDGHELIDESDVDPNTGRVLTSRIATEHISEADERAEEEEKDSIVTSLYDEESKAEPVNRTIAIPEIEIPYQSGGQKTQTVRDDALISSIEQRRDHTNRPNTNQNQQENF